MEDGLRDILARLTDEDSREVEQRTRRHRRYLTEMVVPELAVGLLAAAEARPVDPFEFLADHLIRYVQSDRTYGYVFLTGHLRGISH